MEDHGAAGSGRFAQELIISKLAEIHVDVKEIRAQGVKASSRITALEGQVSVLPCAEHSAANVRTAERLASLDEKFANRLGWKSLVVAIIPAVSAGIVIGWKLVGS